MSRIDPRKHLGAAVGWAVFLILALAALLAAAIAAHLADNRLRADSEQLLGQYATQIRHQVSLQVELKRTILQSIAASANVGNVLKLDGHLSIVQQQFPDFAWLGVASRDGNLISSSNRSTINVSGEQWFKHGLRGFYLGDNNPTDKQVPEDRLLLPVIHTSVPVRSDYQGVLGARLHQSWIQNLRADLIESLELERKLEIFVTTENNIVFIGPTEYLGKFFNYNDNFDQNGDYLIARHNEVHDEHHFDLDWDVYVRQSADEALASAKSASRLIFYSVLLSGLFAALASVWIVSRLMSRLSLLEVQTRGVQFDQSATFVAPSGKDEIHRIGTQMAALVSQLQQEKEQLNTLNAELDERVAERTATIERLAAEARDAAVNSERLRMARDLHDTLANSLMALLTQIRLMLKVAPTLKPGEIQEELKLAEQVAAHGLAESRAAIINMRKNSVREIGLSTALRKYADRFSERHELKTTLAVDAEDGTLNCQNSETVFRIAKEALRNIARHASAQHVTINLMQKSGSQDPTANTWTLEITDDGVGFDSQNTPEGHYGLQGIREQAELIGASLSITSQSGKGTNVVIEFLSSQPERD